MTQKIEQSQRQERVAAWNRRAECDLAAFQNSPKQTYQAEKARDRKLCANLEEAIRRSGLQDGMTVSFHHAFRGGDLTVNMVMDVIAKMGFKNLTLASSSLSDCHAPLVEHIRQGVVTRIYTSGLRGPLAEEISRGLLAEPVQIHSHGGRVHLVQSGELNIDVAFLGVPSCDEFGNANGYTGKACCGSLGYAMVDADNAKQVVMLTEELLPYPHNPASIEQDQVDLIVKVDRVGDQINQIGNIISQRDKKAILERCSEILDRGVSVEQFVVDLTDYFRNLLFLKCGIRKSSLLSGSPDDYPQELIETFSTEQLEKAIELLLELHRNLRFSLQQRFDLELVMCQLASLQDLIDPAELLKTIQAVKTELFSSASISTTGIAGESSLPDANQRISGPKNSEAVKPSSKSGSLKELIVAVRKEKLALSTLLEKSESWEVADGELRLLYKAQDRFSAEQVRKERDTVIQHASTVFPEQEVLRLRVEVVGGEQSSASSINEQAEIVKKIFRGEIVEKGE